MRRLILQMTVLLLICSSIAAEEEPEFELTPGMKLEQKMVAERLKIKSGKVVLLYLDYLSRTMNEGEEYPRKSRTFYESDGLNTRAEHPVLHRAGCTYKEIRVACENEFFTVISNNDTTFINRTQRTGETRQKHVWRPAVFGSGLYYSIIWGIDPGTQSLALKDRIAHIDRINEQITNETLNGIPTRHVTYDLPNGNHVEYWIAPQQGHSLLKSIYKSIIKNKIGILNKNVKQQAERVTTYEAEWKQYSGGVWFPAKWKNFSQQGNVVRSNSEYVTEEADFVTSVPPERFSLQSFTETKKKIKYYDGQLGYTPEGIKTMAEYKEYLYKIGGRPPGEEENDSKKWGKIFVAIILALLAVVLISQKRKNKWKA